MAQLRCTRILATAFAVLSAAMVPFSHGSDSAPFGLRWGAELATLPESADKRRDRNITVLLFTKEYLPADFRDIEEVIMKVCDAEGLQQIHAVSRLLAGTEARERFASAYGEAVRRYGESSEGNPEKGTASWSKARVSMFAKLVKPSYYRIVIVHDGPGFASCAKTYDARRGAE